jgi:hypothetical protein
MTCDECREWLPEAAAGELGRDAPVDAVRAHLQACAECRRRVEAFGALLSGLRGLPAAKPGTRAVLAVTEHLHRRAASASARRTEFGPVLDLDDLAEYLRVDRDSLDDYLDEIPSFEIGGRLRFRRESVETWIASRERVPVVRMMPRRSEPPSWGG